jgi:cysteine desulfurase
MLAVYPCAFILGARTERLPTNVNICLPGIEAEDFVDQMAANNVAISAGSACSYGARKPSYVALAHGVSYDEAKSCIRLSLSIESTEQDVERFLQIFRELVEAHAEPSGMRRETA